MKYQTNVKTADSKKFPIKDIPGSTSDNAAGEPGKGVAMKKWQPFSDFVLKNLVKDAELINGNALVSEDGRPVVAIAAHGPGFAWIPLAALVGKFFVDNGHGETIGGLFPHKALFLVPGLKNYYKKNLGAPTDVHTVDALVDLLKNGKIGMTGTAPEGANCIFSFDEYVAPFRSKGMIAAAIKSGAAICLMAHQGAESWNITFNLPFGWTVPLTSGLRGFNLTLLPWKKISRYTVLCRQYQPCVTAAELKNSTKQQARRLLNVEIEKIRAEMNLMTDEIKETAKQSPRLVKMKSAGRRKSSSKALRPFSFPKPIFPTDEAYGF